MGFTSVEDVLAIVAGLREAFTSGGTRWLRDLALVCITDAYSLTLFYTNTYGSLRCFIGLAFDEGARFWRDISLNLDFFLGLPGKQVYRARVGDTHVSGGGPLPWLHLTHVAAALS